MKVNLAGIVNESITDGAGLRITLFFQGCPHRCRGCHNPHTWDIQGGTTYEVDELCARLKLTPIIRGVTLSGGEPFLQPEAAAAIARFFIQQRKDVWAYTGYCWQALLAHPDASVRDLIKLCDVIVDGPYIQAQRSLELPFRGSCNQRLIAVQPSLQQGRVVEWQTV